MVYIHEEERVKSSTQLTFSIFLKKFKLGMCYNPVKDRDTTFALGVLEDYQIVNRKPNVLKESLDEK